MAAGHLKRIALIGYGNIAKYHEEVFRALECPVIAVCDISLQSRQSALAAGIPQVYDSAKKLIETEKPDGIVVAVPYMFNYEVASQLIPYKIPLLLEKPPGVSLEQFNDLIQLSELHGTPVMVGTNRRHYSVVRKALEEIGGKENITHVFVEWSEDSADFLSTGVSPEGIKRLTFGNTIHGIDLLTFLAGDIRESSIYARDFGNNTEQNRWMMSMHGISSQGALVTVCSTWDSPARWRIGFTVKDRRYTFAPLESCKVLTRGSWKEREIEPDEADLKYKAGFYKQAETFLEVVKSGRNNILFGLQSATPAMKLAEALTNKFVMNFGSR